MTAPGFPNWGSCLKTCTPVGPDAPIGPLRRDTTCRVRFRRETISLPRTHTARPYASGLNHRTTFLLLRTIPIENSQALPFRDWRLQFFTIQGRRPGNSRIRTRACAPDVRKNFRAGRPRVRANRPGDLWVLSIPGKYRAAGLTNRSFLPCHHREKVRPIN